MAFTTARPPEQVERIATARLKERHSWPVIAAAEGISPGACKALFQRWQDKTPGQRPAKQERRCLGVYCAPFNRTFLSTGPGNRICERCAGHSVSPFEPELCGARPQNSLARPRVGDEYVPMGQ